MKKEVEALEEGVKVRFTGAVEKRRIVAMVENCRTGGCECMSEETKAKITGMAVRGEDGAVELELGGELATDEIEAALARSKVLNS